MNVDATSVGNLEDFLAQYRWKGSDADQVWMGLGVCQVINEALLLVGIEGKDRQAFAPRQLDERRRRAGLPKPRFSPGRYNDAGDRCVAIQYLKGDERRGAAGTKEEDAQAHRVYSAAVKAVRRFVFFVVIVAVLLAGGRLLLPFMARRLIRNDPLARADMIVVLGSRNLERTLEAGMLFREGWAPRVMLLRPPDVVRDSLRHELGIRVPVFIDIQRDALVQMGVPARVILDFLETQDSTRNEAEAIAEYARQKGYRRLIVVTSPYHTGRAGSFFNAAAKSSFQIIMRADRYESVDPSRWWRRYPDRTDVVLEYLKTLYAPFSS